MTNPFTRRRFLQSSLAVTVAAPGLLRAAAATSVPAIPHPATYFLQDAITRGLNTIANRLDPLQDNRPFFYLRLQPTPKLTHAIWDLGDMTSRWLDAFILGRQVTGSAAHLGGERSLRRRLPTCDPYAHPFMAGRVLLTYVDEYLQEPSAENRDQVNNLVRLIRSKMTFENDYAFYFKPRPGWRSLDQSLGDFAPYPTSPLGGIILALSRYTTEAPSPESEDLLDRLCRFVLNVSHTFEKDGRYRGHTHSGGILTAMAGILRHAIHQNDRRTIDWMRNAFDWTLQNSSSWGWVPDGLGAQSGSCETCSLTDALHVAILLARHVDPKYFSTVERFARNQLLENQFRNPERMFPPGDFPNRAAVTRALDGSWASWSLPNSLDNCTQGVEGCCLGSGIRGCFLVWESIVEKRSDAVYVHMPLSRNSPWVEIISHQPYSGRVDILIHDATRLKVRLPDWVNPKEARATVSATAIAPPVTPDRYLTFENLHPNDLLSVTYPLYKEERAEQINGQSYRPRWRGDTVVSIQPPGQKYPLYERASLEHDEPPLLANNAYTSQTGGPVHW